ncbi:aminotransferase class V-fold PLP-dependent enzyme [Rubrivirga sp. S365]|uniref:Aminotransferase class V-fold PLP-dependent enzyme n=1 Tax=Rubrivirga litoralis TaxID=3075598 RepID=A0ABU3BMB8_9BACT|nr:MULTISPECIES: aminotransferase class V-fold PLP-dependent enzyme [unclassified Rubrivirga]MDT0630437.1 aminotransferase class V-fold PLP-dependent enzyme [Rubrivirga sp. F394]MDT7857584.1 aminotransferase class V-fold PLP-dependent enzyme [Rubrivirga sp. S365]
MLRSQKDLFALPPDLHYLNAAYLSPQLRAVEAAGVSAIRVLRDPTQVGAADFFDDSDHVRALFADLVGSPGSADRVALVPAASYGVETVAQNVTLGPGRSVVVLGGQFPSHVYPWRRLAAETGGEVRTVEAPAPLGAEGRGAGWSERLLDAIDADTAVIAVPHVHWADGTRFDLEAVGARAREVGAALVVDGTQSVGALPFDLDAIRPDALVCAGYKWLLGPAGTGTLYLGERFADGRPLEETWLGRAGSDDFSGLTDYADDYGPGAVRFDMGGRANGILLPMLIAGLQQLRAWGVGEVQATCAARADVIVDGARALGYAAEDAAWRAGHLFGLAPPPGIEADAVRRALAERNVAVSTRGGVVRVSPHVYNDGADVDALLGGLAAATGRGRAVAA